MKKIIFGFLMAILMLSGALAYECSDCYGDPANTPELDIIDCWVEIDGRLVYPDRTIYKSFERGDEVEVSVEFVSKQDAEDVQIQALILGYEHGDRIYEDVSDITSSFDVKANRSYQKELQLTIPDDIGTGELKIRVIISDRSSSTWVRDYNLDIEAQKHYVVIKRFTLDPSQEVLSGRGLLAKVYVKNMGDREEEGVVVTVSIPELDLEATEFIDELDPDDSTKPEDDLYLRIPMCTEPGTYVVRATVEYDDGYEEVSKETTIEILEDETCETGGAVLPGDEKTIVTVPGKQDVVVGTSGAVYPIMISNTGSTAKSYVLTISGVDAWGTYRIDPSSVIVVDGKSTKTAYVYVTANADASEGEKIFLVKVESASESKEVPLTANIVAGEAPAETDWERIKQGLEIGLVVLVVLLVLLGLIIGFNKLRGTKEEESEELTGQTYY
ncbi:hypothetical protein JW930_06310 [Candidatus Woesearchaeota archaeon]|nr:hypothetical protein [Candidatus Woesearchaeota archaeon]